MTYLTRRKEELQENVCYILRECFLLGFPGRRKRCSPRDATLSSYMQRYLSSTPPTKPRVVFIKMLNPPSIPLLAPLKKSIRLHDDITDLFSHAPRSSRHSYPNFDFVWIIRARYRLTCRMRKRKVGRGSGREGGKIYGDLGDVLKGLEMERHRVLGNAFRSLRIPISAAGSVIRRISITAKADRSFPPPLQRERVHFAVNGDIIPENWVVGKVKASRGLPNTLVPT